MLDKMCFLSLFVRRLEGAFKCTRAAYRTFKEREYEERIMK